MDLYRQEEENTYDYIDNGAFSNYAYEGLSDDAYKTEEKFNVSRDTFSKSPLPKSRQKRCLIMFIIAAVLLIVIIAVVIWVVVRKNEKNTANAPKQFEATLTLGMTWIPVYSDTNSIQYQQLTSDLLKQTEDALKRSDIGKDLDHITISTLRPGSVICDINIFMETAKYSVNGASRDITTVVIQERLTDIVETAKINHPASILAKVDTSKIAVRKPVSETQSGSELTTLSPYTTSPPRQTQSPATTSTARLYSTTSAIVTGGNSPCTNVAYLQTILTDKCFDISKYYQALQSTDVSAEICRFLHETVRCVINEVFMDTGITCPVDINDQLLADNADYIQSIISIDPRICFLPPTSEAPHLTRYPSTDMTRSTVVKDTGSPCTNTSYLEELLLRQCVDYVRFAAVLQSDMTEKCKFVVDVIDCVLRKVLDETGVVCTTAQKDTIIAENAGTVQQLLSMDIMTCFP
ncbi:uncharacterized protein LOC125659843 [Ostrea edulis]|uniref:uncharacterized protein LOC125659843 n=1 Tax=Ostrea edulis TaxID=37623 RepID=UPI0024AEF964|nr:uncharacterized protein LOC125659843 [Ostrea edulis]XP_056006235.1 uncharacterized protein LOC125659843 [Ostrea edulis]XP_056006236.1 uncharacterized protein LOC125659843 [Ostrea edulis]